MTEFLNIPLEQLKVSPLNMRRGRTRPPIDDILPSIRARGVLVPLLVRPNGEENVFEIVAGRRRYFASKEVERETGETRPLPCRVLAAGDDAAAVEASLIENVARLDPDEMQQFEAFKALADKGRTIEEIASVFGVTELTVRRRLALANLIPAIRKAYSEERLDGASVMALTLATEKQQREWLEMFEDEGVRAPLGRDLKRWLLGGGDIATEVALFPLDAYDGDIFEDLFGERSVFADAEKFWTYQEAAVEAEREKLLEAGWTGVTVLERGAHFESWKHVETPKKDGGEIFIEIRHSGEVVIHKGYAPRRKETKEKTERAKRECSAPLENYIDLHRHAAARATLLSHQGAALRLIAATLIVGAPNLSASADRQRAAKEEIAASIKASKAEDAMQKERAEIAALLGFETGRSLTGGNGDGYQLAVVFAKLLTLSDEDVARILTFLAAETLSNGRDAVEALGFAFPIDIGAYWTPDEAFFDLLRDRKIVNQMLAEIGGKTVAKANRDAPAKVQKAIIRDHLSGANGREATPDWRPRWITFPAACYGKTGVPGAAARSAKLAALFER